MSEAGSQVETNVVVLPPVADDPVFGDQAPGDAPDASRRIGTDPHDFAGLFIKHKWSFQLHARRFLTDRRDIEEVVQEGFLKLFLALPELETELQALAYARRTITNLCIDRYRADQRRPRLIDLESLSVEPATDEDENDPLVQAENAAIVREALAMLSPLHREALIKREIEEKPLAVIAEELEIPVEQVKHVLHRARRSLRRLLVGTHVEPGVDLDLALVLAANRARAAGAAKPVGASVVAILVLIAGVLGLRPDQPAPRTTDLAAPTAPSLQLPAGPSTERAPSARVPSAAAPHAPAQVHQVPVAPHHRRVLRRTRGVKPVTSGGLGTATEGKGRAVTPGSPSVTTKPPVTSPPPVVVPPQSTAYSSTGVGAVGAARVANQMRAVTAGGHTSRSTFQVPTAQGTYALNQAFSFAPDGSLSGVVLNEAVPVSGGGVGTLAETPDATATTLPDGSLRLSVAGLAVPIGSVNGETVGPRQLDVELVLAPDGVQVVSEQVSVTPSAPPADPADPAAQAPSDPGATPPGKPEEGR